MYPTVGHCTCTCIIYYIIIDIMYMYMYTNIMYMYTNIDIFPSLTVGLFVSNMKILELMKELQHLQDNSCLDISKQDSTAVSLMEDVEPCQARIGISGEIRV